MILELQEQYLNYIKTTHQKLGIANSYEKDSGLIVQFEAETLVFIGLDCFGRYQRMEPIAAATWQKMRKAALLDNITLNSVSAFRSVQYQFILLENKLSKGQTIEDILKLNAAPGHSEHHTGQAIDICEQANGALSEKFEQTAAFQWLMKNAGDFQFKLSYPRDNPFGIMYEPWHWRFI
jgi:D-alanyl-D-alanine carboxypeptidase